MWNLQFSRSCTLKQFTSVCGPSSDFCGDICFYFTNWPQGGAFVTQCWVLLSLLSFVIVAEKCCVFSWDNCIFQYKVNKGSLVWNRGRRPEQYFQSCFWYLIYLMYFTCLGPPSMTQRISSVEVSENGTMVLSPSSPVKTKVDEVSEILWRLLRFKLHSILCWKKGKLEKNSKRRFCRSQHY